MSDCFIQCFSELFEQWAAEHVLTAEVLFMYFVLFTETMTSMVNVSRSVLSSCVEFSNFILCLRISDKTVDIENRF